MRLETLPTAAEAVEDALASCVELVNPVDRGVVPGDVGGEAPVPRALAGAEDEPEGGLGPPEEVQEPFGEGLSGAVLPPVSGRGVCGGGEGLGGVGICLGPRSPPWFPRPWWGRLGTSGRSAPELGAPDGGCRSGGGGRCWGGTRWAWGRFEG